MLRELHITNLAIIEDVHVELDPGLTVFTGTTGAGKSLVVGALQLLLGLKAGKDMLRASAGEGRVSGLFDASNASVRTELESLTDVAVEDDEVLITRRLLASGRSSCSVNGQPVTVAMLQAVGERLIDLHGQYDHQFLLRPANQLAVLDAYAGLEDLRGQLTAAYEHWREQIARREALARDADVRRQQLELYDFQAAEIDEANVRPGELEDVEARHRRLANVERIRQATSAAYARLSEDDGLLDALRSVVSDLDDLTEYDAELTRVVEPCRSASLALDEAANDLRRYAESLDFDQAELEEVDARLSQLRRLCEKYGGSVDALLAYRKQIGTEREDLRLRQGDYAEIDQRVAESRQAYESLAKKAASKRRTAAKRLGGLIDKQLAELGMDKAHFEMKLTQADPGPTGEDEAEMLVRTNPGQPMHPLRRIASGGEMSRVMLAIKSVLAETDRVSVLVFDEVDAHVGGRLGAVIGQKLRSLSRNHQVICITHLPQIAAFADRHLKVSKRTRGQDTRTTVQLVDGQERVDELAEMIAGERTSATSRRQAKELLKQANG